MHPERDRLRELLNATDPAVVRQGCELLAALAMDSRHRSWLTELAEGTIVGRSGNPVWGLRLYHGLSKQNTKLVMLWVLRVLGRLDGVPFLCLEENFLRDLSVLSGLEDLCELELCESYHLRDLSGLTGLTRLRHLDLRSSPSLETLNGLGNLPCLTVLILSECKELGDISRLSAYPTIEELHLGDCDRLTDLSSLRALPALRYLDLRGCYRIPSEVRRLNDTRGAVLRVLR